MAHKLQKKIQILGPDAFLLGIWGLPPPWAGVALFGVAAAHLGAALRPLPSLGQKPKAKAKFMPNLLNFAPPIDVLTSKNTT